MKSWKNIIHVLSITFSHPVFLNVFKLSAFASYTFIKCLHEWTQRSFMIYVLTGQEQS